MARTYTDSVLGGLPVGPIGSAEGEAPAVRVRAEPPANAHPPRGAQGFAITFAGAAPGPATGAEVPKVVGLVGNFSAADLDARWPILYRRNDPQAADFTSGNGGGLRWGGGSEAAGARATAVPHDATGALLTYDLNYVTRVGFSIVLEDRVNNQRLRFKVQRGQEADGNDDRPRLTIRTERSEGAPDVLTSVQLADVWGARPVRSIRCGYNGNLTLRFEALRSPVGQPDQWEGLTSFAVPEPFRSLFNPAAVHVWVEGETWAYNGLVVDNLRGTLPVGPAYVPAGPVALALPMPAPPGGPLAGDAFTVPDDFCAVVEEVAVSLAAIARPPLGAGQRKPALADLWVRLLVDGVPAPGLNEIRPTALLLGPDVDTPGHVYTRTIRPRLTLKSGQRVGAELMVRDAAAGHPVECAVAGWIYPADLKP